MMTSRTGSRRKSSQGFTLIEVLVAVTILSIGIILVLGAFDTALSALDSARVSMRAHELLKQKLDAVEVHGLPVGTSGVFPDNSDYEWRIETKPIHRAEKEVLREVIITVWRTSGGVHYSMGTYMRMDV